MMVTQKQLELYRATASDKLRPVLLALHITGDYVEATDGFQLVRLAHAVKQPNCDFLIEGSDAKDILSKLPKRSINAEIELSPAIVKTDDHDDIIITVTVPEGLPYQVRGVLGNYPKTQTIIDQAEKQAEVTSIVIDYNVLAKTLETMKRAGSHTVKLSIKGKLDPIEVSPVYDTRPEDNHGQLFALVMPVNS